MASNRILVVEDETIIAKEIEHALKGFGYDVLGIIPRGEDAVEFALRERPDLILMDIMLAGGMDGTEAAAAIRREIDVPVIFSTAYTDQETVDRVKPTTPYGYLVKPFEHTDLRIAVETALYRSDIERKLRARELELRQAQKMEAVGTLASGIAHDFNNILSAIIGYSEMAMQRVDESEPLYRMLSRIHGAGGRAKRLVRLLLDFSKPPDTEHDPVDLREVVDEALGVLQGAMPEGVDIAYTPPDAPCMVRADPTQLHQVALNLMKNAVDAMPDGGRLAVELCSCTKGESGRDVCETALSRDDREGEVGGRVVVLGVGDTGCGMDAEVRQRAFDPFYTTKPSGEGTGMGLALVHGIVRSYGGWVTLDSTQGEGTQVTVSFPLEVV